VISLAILGIIGFIYGTNIGQLVHHTPNPTWFERIGR
jgi:hypothetical protein